MQIFHLNVINFSTQFQLISYNCLDISISCSNNVADDLFSFPFGQATCFI